jgi:hypothetical protein
VGRCTGIVLRVATALGIAAAIAGFPEAGASAAQRIALTLTYTCAFPEIGDQSASVYIESDIPNSIAVGQPTGHYVVTASATAPWELAAGLHAFGVSTITGSVDGRVDVEAPQGDFAETIPLGIPEITVPAFSSFTAGATGGSSEITFDEPGQGEIVVGSLLLHLVPRNSSGGLTPLGAFNVPCSLNAGQDDVAASFTITGAASSASSSVTTRPTGRTLPSGKRSSSPSPSASNGTIVQRPTASPSESVRATATESVRATATGLFNGEDTSWAIWLGGLAALVATGAAAFRYGQRPRNR